jgi:Uma2 family endonuclease
MVVCDKSKIGSEGIRGAPDLVIEILSPSNTAIEMAMKLKLYQQAGVREYWVVDPENQGLSVHSFKGDTILTTTYGNTGTVSFVIFPDFSITLERVFADLTLCENLLLLQSA